MLAQLSRAPGKSSWRWQRVVAGLVGGAPFVFLTAFAIEPLVQQGIGSFFNWYDLKPNTFAGLRDYRDVFGDPVARSALLHTVVYVAITVPLEVGLGFIGAWMVTRVRRGRSVLIALYVVPLVIPWAPAANLFLGFFNAGGVLDGIRARLFGAHHAVLWFQNPRLAFTVVVLIGTWKGAPWCFLLMFAAINASRHDLFEAGRIDGARGLSYWSHVVVPAVWPMLMFVTVFRTFVEAQTYAAVALVTGGGPINATQLASTYDQTLAFSYFQFGPASALSTLTGAALLLVAVGGFAVMRLGPGPVISRLLALPDWVEGRIAETRRAHSVPAGHWSYLRRGPLWWISSSTRRSRRVNAGVVWVMALVTLLPLAGGLPGDGLQPDVALPWALVRSGLENSFILTAATLLGTLLLALPAAYLLARGESRLRSGLFVFVLAAMAVPGALLLLPQYQEMAWLGLVNTRLGLVLLYVAANLPLAVFFLRAAFASVPESLVESMHVDGASRWHVVTRLFVPLSASTIVTVTVFVVIAVFNEVPLAVSLLNSSSLYPLPILAALGTGGIGSLSASWLSIGPPLLLFLACQRVFQRGMLSGTLL